MPKPNTNRRYKRGAPHKDARLFIIVAEGEREDNYFNWFNERNQRIRIHIVPREGQASAPKHFLSRLEKYLEEAGAKSANDDSIWFVLDVDRWQRADIDSLIKATELNSNWHTAISNPCFEVWLHCHIAPPPTNMTDCGKLKIALNTLFFGGYAPDKACPLVETAIKHAKEIGGRPEKAYPNVLQTKVFQLAMEMVEILGKKWMK